MRQPAAVMREDSVVAVSTAALYETVDGSDAYELREVIRAGLDATAPYLNVPSHVMVQPDGEIRGVNYDHCILAVRASLKLMRHMRRKERLLPMAQAI